MAKLIFKWLLLLAAVVSLVRVVFFSATAWSVASFFLCGGAWYWLTWRKTRELDAAKPR